MLRFTSGSMCALFVLIVLFVLVYVSIGMFLCLCISGLGYFIRSVFIICIVDLTI